MSAMPWDYDEIVASFTEMNQRHRRNPDASCSACGRDNVRTDDGEFFCITCNWDVVTGDVCVASTERGTRCRRRAYGGVLGGAAFCHQHHTAAVLDLDARREEVAKRHAPPEPEPAPVTYLDRERCGSVYYVERAGFVKIGKANNVQTRIRSLVLGGIVMPPGVQPGPVNLLAVHAGGRAAERANHRRFAADRVAGEWFRLSPELAAHIDAINARRR